MKILVFGEKYFNFTDSTVFALNKLGHEAKVYYMNVLHNTELNFSDYIRYKIKDSNFIKSFYQQQKNKLHRIIDEFQPDMLLSINGNSYVEYIDKDLLIKLKEQKCKSVLWFMDTIKRFEHIEQNIELFDVVLSFEPDDVKYIKDKYNVDAKYLLVGASEEIYCQNNSSHDYMYDICFVGNPTEDRLNILNKIAEFCNLNDKKMIIYGHYWHNKYWWQELFAKKKFAEKYPVLVKYINNKLLNGNQVAELYVKSKICLNIHILVHKGVNARTFDILGNGNFQICDYRDNANQIGLIDKENIVMYKNVEECIDKINYYLNHDEERINIGKKGRFLVNSNYTISKIMYDFLEALNG